MKFIFVCPNKNEVFESSDFQILENRGVTTDDAGNKTLDAKVALNEPCPFCGTKACVPCQRVVVPVYSIKTY